jgi:DNA-directed RNA polymerase specialized sigma24 family protein
MAVRPEGAAPLTLADAAVSLANGEGEAGRRLRRTLEAQLIRRDVPAADRDDVRADVACALLLSARSELVTLDAACAHVALVARNKAVDLYRRGRREALEDGVAERAAEAPGGSLQRDLDAVSGEVHRRHVSHSLRELVRDLPSDERLALTATATGAGYLGSGLARSSHYRALERARLRLSAVVRSRVAAGLALPAVLLRTLGHLRSLALPAAATAAALVASAAFVLPALTPAVPAYARARVAPGLARATTAVARQPQATTAAPARLVHRRVQVRRAAAVRTVPVARPVAHPIARRRVTQVAPASPASPPATGLGPCRAARLCQ